MDIVAPKQLSSMPKLIETIKHVWVFDIASVYCEKLTSSTSRCIDSFISNKRLRLQILMHHVYCFYTCLCLLYKVYET